MTPASKSQIRALTLAGLKVSGSYAACAETLEAAGMRPDGLPMQMGWREAGKLSDAALMSKIGGFYRFSSITETADYGR